MPKPLFHKLAATIAVGFFCFIIGCPYSFIAKDPIFFYMSSFLFICCLTKGAMLYHTVKKGHFITILTACIRIKKKPLGRNIQVWFQPENGCVFELSLDSRTIKVHPDREYLLYFKGTGESGVPDNPAMLFLCLEEINYHSLPDNHGQTD